jgi:hypothetical protein
MRSDQDRIAELERTVADLQRRLNDVPCRPAQPPVPRNGWWLAELTEALEPQQNPDESPNQAEAEILQWNGEGFVGSGQHVQVRDFWQTTETLAIGTRIEIAWYRNVWIYRRTGATDTFVVFELKEDLLIKSSEGDGPNGEQPGQALAAVCELNGDLAYEPTQEEIIVVDPTPTDGYGLWSGYVGYQGLARKRDEEPENGELPRYDIVWMERPAMIVRFEVLEDREPGAPEIKGKLLDPAGFQHGDRDPPLDQAESAAGDDFLPIQDPNFLFPRALKGGKGLAAWNDRLDKYECLVVQQQAMVIGATANTGTGIGFSGIGGFVPLDNVTVVSASPFNLLPEEPPTQGWNTQGHRGQSGDNLLLVWDETFGEWIIFDVQRHDKKVAIDFRLSADKTTWQAKMLNCALEFSDNPADSTLWTDFFTTKPCG